MTRIDLEALQRELSSTEKPVPVGEIVLQAVDAAGPDGDIRGRSVIFSELSRIKITAGEPARAIDLVPTDGTFCWRIEIAKLRPKQVIELHVLVPVSSTPIPIGDLPRVDPRTLQPSPEAEAAWEAVARLATEASNEAILAAERAVDAAESVEGDVGAAAASAAAAANSADAAAESASQALTSANIAGGSANAAGTAASNAAISANDASAGALDARSSATTASSKANIAAGAALDAAGSAGAADGSADAAAASAGTAAADAARAETARAGAETARTTADQRATDAAASASAAGQSKTAAATSETNAATARTGAETARTGAETARTGAETAQTGAVTARTGAETAKTGAEAARDLALAGQFAGSDLGGANTNLDTMLTPGVFYQTRAAQATAANKYPIPGLKGVLIVTRATGAFSEQLYIGEGGFGYYIRTGTSTSWTPWAFIPTQSMDVTLGRRIFTRDDYNNRYQMTFGDTGRRQFVTADMLNGVTGNWTIRRNGYTVSIEGNPAPGSDIPAGSSVAFGVIPAGFRPTLTNMRQPFRTGSSTFMQGIMIASTTFEISLYAFQNYTVSQGPTPFSLTFQTVDAWPTSLPGAALGVIPVN